MEDILLFIDRVLGEDITAQLEYSCEIEEDIYTDHVFNVGATVETVTVRVYGDGEMAIVE